MRVMSFDLRYDNVEDGQYRWRNRFPAVKKVFKEYKPDIVGIQEGLPHQVDDLKNFFDFYKYFGTGRKEEEGSEQIGIFYKEDNNLILKESGNIWLSKTHDIKGSKDLGSDVPRLANWIVFNIKEKNKDLLVINTHYDNVSKLAREKSTEIISDFVKDKNITENIVVTGDFNTGSNSKPIKNLKTNIHLKDALAELGKKESTFHDFAGDGIFRIDFIFCSKLFNIKDGGVIKNKFKEIYPSDHYPIYADLSF